MSKMTEKEVDAALKEAPEWALVGEAIQRTYHFPDFAASMRFVNAVAEEAERVRHHPDMLVRYNKVTLTLATHDAGGITARDFALAKTADSFVPAPVPVETTVKPAPVKGRRGKV